jgi:hypothetical protein
MSGLVLTSRRCIPGSHIRASPAGGSLLDRDIGRRVALGHTTAVRLGTVQSEGSGSAEGITGSREA